MRPFTKKPVDSNAPLKKSEDQSRYGKDVVMVLDSMGPSQRTEMKRHRMLQRLPTKAKYCKRTGRVLNEKVLSARGNSELMVKRTKTAGKYDSPKRTGQPKQVRRRKLLASKA